MEAYAPNYGPPGTEPDYVGSRNRGQRTIRAPSARLSTDQQLSAQTSALKLSDNLPKPPTPANMFATKSLKMKNERKAWISKYRDKLTANHPELLAREIDDMTEEAWKEHLPILEDHLSRALKVREGKRWRRKQNKRNPKFAEQRALRVTELSVQMLRSNPGMTSGEAQKQARWLEQQETVDAADRALLHRKQVSIAEKAARREKKARAAEAGRIVNYKNANGRRPLSPFSKLGKALVEELGGEDDYEPPESFEQPTKRADAAFPEIKLEENSEEEDDYEPPESFGKPQGRYHVTSPPRTRQHESGESKVLAAYERANHDAEASVAKNTMQRTENTTQAMRGMSAQHKDVLRAEIRKFQAERLEAGGQKALKAGTRENEPRKDDARVVEVQKQEALRRERLYQVVVKRDNMNRWLQQLTLDEPEVMLDEEMEEPQEMEETEHMHVE